MSYTEPDFIILCYGDSNTHGSIPNGNHERYPRSVRWPGHLQNLLGEKYHIVEEGLGGRTTCLDDPKEEGRNGSKYLLPCLKSHRPIDLVILMLGTNDLKKHFSLTAEDVANNAGELVKMIQTSQTGRGSLSPRVLLIAPPPLAKLSEFKDEFEGGIKKSQEIGKFYQKQAGQLICEFLDAGKFIQSSDKDGIHWELCDHIELAEEIAKKINELHLFK